jgi:hypothetical protein
MYPSTLIVLYALSFERTGVAQARLELEGITWFVEAGVRKDHTIATG